MLKKYQTEKTKENDRQRARVWYANPINKGRQLERQFFNQLKYNYGLSMKDFSEMLNIQNGVCMICKKVCSSGQRLSVDHDHKTGKNRGLLCRKCNSGLGLFGDSVELLQKAIDYLKFYA